MDVIETKLQTMGLVLPARMQLPPGAVLPFSWVRLHGNRAILSGHGPLAADGTLAKPLGQVGAEVSPEQGYYAARLTGLAMLAGLPWNIPVEIEAEVAID